MKKKAENLRKKAEAILKQKRSIPDESFKKLGIDKLIEELSIYQVELEMQHEALLERQDDLQKSKDRFEGLFNHAPSGYVFLNQDHQIVGCNNTF